MEKASKKYPSLKEVSLATLVYIPLNVTLAGYKEPDPVCVGRLGTALRVRPGPAGLRPPVCRGSLGHPAGDTV